MKLSNNNYIKSAAAGIAVAALLFTTGCSKEDIGANPPDSSEPSAITDRRVQEDVRDFSERIPAISWYNSTMNKIITIDPKSEQKNFSFSDPNPGWNFSDASETTWTPAPQGGGVLFIGAGSFGSNAGGSGTVVAGSTALNISSTFCFSASEDALGLEIGGFGGPDPDGISGVIGIAGNLEALSTGEFDEESIFDFFQGMAYYVVYDNEANGNYTIIDWFEDLDQDPEDLDGEGFSWVYSFSESEWAVYFSQNGTLNVSGGSMNFQGNYFGLILNIDDIFSEEGGDITGLEFVQDQYGLGQMGCN
jgi:hypothetical protein